MHRRQIEDADAEKDEELATGMSDERQWSFGLHKRQIMGDLQ